MDIVDNYLQPRTAITDNVDLQHIQEVGGYCPLCGKMLIVKKNKRISKNYQIAHIYPNSPNEHQRQELAGLERLGISCEDFENKIALCRDCHALFDDHTTKEEYLKIISIKKQLLQENTTQASISTEDIETELLLIMEKLSEAGDEEISKQALNYKGIKIVDKLEDNYVLLRRKIEFNVCTYFGLIKENMKNLSDENRFNFDLVASEVKTAYLKASAGASDKGIIFNSLVKWMKSKIPQASDEGCEIMVSFFVQNCEVYDEISK